MNGWVTLKHVLHRLPEITKCSEYQLPTVVTGFIMYSLLASFFSLSQFPMPLTALPQVASHINDLPTNLDLDLLLWNPNKDRYPPITSLASSYVSHIIHEYLELYLSCSKQFYMQEYFQDYD